MLSAVSIFQAQTPQDMACARELFQQYADSVGAVISLRNFGEELAGLPGEYGPPQGRLLLAFCARRAAGCVTLRKLEESICEMRRLYVRNEFRGQGLGHELVHAAISAAREIGYQRIRLDNLSSMQDAIALYRSLNFKDIPPYHPDPHPDAVYMELVLHSARQSGASALPTPHP
jgi:putative acetyltransferase